MGFSAHTIDSLPLKPANTELKSEIYGHYFENSQQENAGLYDLAMAFVLICIAQFGIDYIGHYFSAQLAQSTLFFISELVGLFSIGVISWYFICYKYHVKFLDGFALQRCSFSTWLFALTAGLMGAIFASLLFNEFGNPKNVLFNHSLTWQWFVVIAILGVVAGLIEECFYRSFALTVLKKVMPAELAFILVIAWFTLAHVDLNGLETLSLMVIGIMGILWTLQRILHDSAIPAITSHIVYNLALLTFIYVNNGR